MAGVRARVGDDGARALGAAGCTWSASTRFGRGGISREAWRQALSTRAAERLRNAPAGALRVVCLHHQLANAPWRTRKRPLARRGRVLEQLAAAGAELVLSGHVHQAGVAERREFEVLAGERSIVVVTAPGLTRPRPHRLGEAQGAHVISADESSITVETHVLDGEAFAPVAERRFPREGVRPAAGDATPASTRSR